MTDWIRIIFIFGIFVCACEAGECCKAYYDLTFTYHDQTWCDTYCCGTSALGALECCDSIFLVAPSEDRTGFCIDFFTKNIWAPILIAVGGFGALLTCIVCCYCCCSHSNRSTGTVVAPAQQPYHTNVMLLNPTSSHPSQQPGYNPSGEAIPVHPPPAVAYPVPANQETQEKHPFES
ncbi:uncharacterized protein LOC123557445 [Mercenaria mercenaria]|uniref:uncharacterized protein LOC123557445 n=1 Tax=Mercenaria mercenaria TaxID=6596 RepID=UPI001E1D953B|nr:uncharacterized protein LOC123557445 [Mercenaria mercenaria]